MFSSGQRKAEVEFWLAQKFARAYNRDFNAHYKALRANRERDSADAFLAIHGRPERIGLQICTATTTERMRDEAIERELRNNVKDCLLQNGIKDVSILVIASSSPLKRNLTAWRDGIVGLHQRYFKPELGRVKLDGDDLEGTVFEAVPFSGIHFSSARFPKSHKHKCAVNFVILKDVLPVQETLQNAVNLKRGKYSDAQNIWLLLHPGEGAHTVETIEIHNIKLDGINEFAQAWWVYPRDGSETEILRLDKNSHEV
jgi:hypothetical protein